MRVYAPVIRVETVRGIYQICSKRVFNLTINAMFYAIIRTTFIDYIQCSTADAKPSFSIKDRFLRPSTAFASCRRK